MGVLIRTNDTRAQFPLVTRPLKRRAASKLEGADCRTPEVMLEEVDVFAASSWPANARVGCSTCASFLSGDRAGNDRLTGDCLSRAGLQHASARQSRFDTGNTATPISRWLRRARSLNTMCDRRVEAAQAAGGAGWIRPRAVRQERIFAKARRWRRDSRLDGVSQGQTRARKESALRLRLRLLRLSAPDRLSTAIG